jgi:hypothetical protein
VVRHCEEPSDEAIQSMGAALRLRGIYEVVHLFAFFFILENPWLRAAAV